MNMALRHTCILGSTAVFIACGLFGVNTASAATLVIDDDITVTAPRTFQRQELGRSTTGAPVEQVSLTRTVPHRDLDLTLVSDVRILDARIATTAKEACEQLNRMYPSSNYSLRDNKTELQRDCYKDAVREAMKQKDTLIGVR